MNFRKTLLGIVGIPLCGILAYGGTGYVSSKINGNQHSETNQISQTNEGVDPYIVLVPALLYSLVRKYEKSGKGK